MAASTAWTGMRPLAASWPPAWRTAAPNGAAYRFSQTSTAAGLPGSIVSGRTVSFSAAVPASGLIGPGGQDLCPSIRASREQMLKVSNVPCPRHGVTRRCQEQALQGGEGTMATDTGSGRDAHTTRGAVIAAGASGTPWQSRAVKRHHRMVMLIIGVNLLRDRRVREQVFLGAITLAALALLARQSQARARAGLIAWLDAEPGPARAGPKAAQLTSRSGLPGRVGPQCRRR
jgi:hypothetical protein